MRIVLIAEKPSFAKAVIDELLFVEPDMDHAEFTLGWASEFYNLNTAFQFRRGEKYSSFPMTGEPEYKPMDFSGRYMDSPRFFSSKKGLSARQTNKHSYAFEADIDNEEFAANVKLADMVYFAIDAGPSGYHTQMRAREWLAHIDGNFEVKHLVTHNLTSREIHRRLIEADDLPDLEDRAKLSVVKRYFDYNYLLNARPIMGMTFEKAFAKSFPWPLSKNELQLLYFVRNREPSNDGVLIEAMSKWKGTGKYPARGVHEFYSGIGNPASRATIIENLVKQGFLERIDRRYTAISQQAGRSSISSTQTARTQIRCSGCTTGPTCHFRKPRPGSIGTSGRSSESKSVIYPHCRRTEVEAPVADNADYRPQVVSGPKWSLAAFQAI